MTEHDDRLYLIHIQECIARIELYTAEGKPAFFSDTRISHGLHGLANIPARPRREMNSKSPRSAEEYFNSRAEKDLQGNRCDTKTQDAVLRNLHTLAGSSQRISEPLKASRPDVDWHAIATFRNVVVHDYLGIDLNQIWDIVKNDLPGLKRAITTMLKEHS